MQENAETSLSILQLLVRNQTASDSEWKVHTIAVELGIHDSEAMRGIKRCMDEGWVEADILDARTMKNPFAFEIARIRVTNSGHDFVREAEANDG